MVLKCGRFVVAALFLVLVSASANNLTPTALVPPSMSATGAAPVNATIQKGAVDVVAVRFSLQMNPSAANGVFSGLSLAASGTGNDSTNILSLKVYGDRNNNGLVDAGDVLLGNGKFAADDGSLDVTISDPVNGQQSNAYLVALGFNAAIARENAQVAWAGGVGFLMMLILPLLRKRFGWVGTSTALGAVLVVALVGCGGGTVVLKTHQVKINSVSWTNGGVPVSASGTPLLGGVLSVQQ